MLANILKPMMKPETAKVATAAFGQAALSVAYKFTGSGFRMVDDSKAPTEIRTGTLKREGTMLALSGASVFVIQAIVQPKTFAKKTALTLGSLIATEWLSRQVASSSAKWDKGSSTSDAVLSHLGGTAANDNVKPVTRLDVTSTSANDHVVGSSRVVVSPTNPPIAAFSSGQVRRPQTRQPAFQAQQPLYSTSALNYNRYSAPKPAYNPYAQAGMRV